LKTDTDTI